MAGPKYTRQTARTYPDPEGSGGYGLEVTAWTDDAWNRAQEARRRYQADQEWQRAHPFLAGARNFLDRAGQFVNDEIFLNKNNIRVRNAQQHPEGLKWFREGGNEAVALLGLGTAPIWAPEVAAALPTLSGTGESGSLLSTLVPQVTSRTAPQLANMLNWGAMGTGALLLGKSLSDNPPTFSTPSFSIPYSSSRVMADAAPADSVSATPANPATPTDSVGSTPTSAPGSEPERNDSTSQRRPSFRERLGNRIAGRGNGQTASGGSTPPNNNQNGSFLGRMLWETEKNNFGPNWWKWGNVGRVGLGFSYPARETVWPAAWKSVKYMTVGPDSVPAQPAVPQAVPTQPVANPTDTVPGQAQPDSTSYNTFDEELNALRQAYGGN